MLMRKRIGIIGGAGPSAGSLMLNKIIEVFQTQYGCKQDHEFPHLLLLNFPFSDLLLQGHNCLAVQEDLAYCLNFFAENRLDIVTIACNTLHGYLPPEIPICTFVHMLAETGMIIRENLSEAPVVISSSSSRKQQLHRKWFECDYTLLEIQQELDEMILAITRGLICSL